MKVMHSSFRIGETTIMASDGCDDKATFGGFRLSLSVSTEADAQRVFDDLAAGGMIDMPLGNPLDRTGTATSTAVRSDTGKLAKD